MTHARRILLILALIAVIGIAGCTGTTVESDDSTDITTTADSTLERSEDNYNVYEDNTEVTYVRYPGEMTKTIYWADKTVCTRWESPQEGGVSCLPFNQTQIDERYDPPSKTS